jgi:ribosomal protein S15P/S13E
VKFISVLPFVLSVTLLCVAQNGQPVPAGIRHAQELQAQNERPLPEPGSGHVDVLALRREADELANLAAAVPSGVQNVSKGLLEKDLIQKLKQIEKLSKHLRGELTR